MKILMISPSLPVPPTSGGAIRVFNLVRQLSATDEIDFLALDDGHTPDRDVQSLRDHCDRVNIIVPKRPAPFRDACAVVRNSIRGEPFLTKYVNYPEFKARLGELTRAIPYDILHFEHSHLGGLLECAVRAEGAATVLSTENVAYDQFSRMARCERNLLEKAKLLLTSVPMRRWEPARASAFDTVITVCERDRQLLLAAKPSLDIAVVPNGVDLESNRPFPRKGRTDNILIVGSMDYQPNVDAVLYFNREIFPLIRKQAPSCTLTIVGRTPPPSIRQLHAPPVIGVFADVPDVKPFYEKALVSIVALRSGGGSRLKILEALALGTPVVSTRVGCEGLDVRDGRDIMIADQPAVFARHVTALMRNPGLWEAISTQGRRLVLERYGWNRMATLLREQYCRCLVRKRMGKACLSPEIQACERTA